jgi:hypothetical protein
MGYGFPYFQYHLFITFHKPIPNFISIQRNNMLEKLLPTFISHSYVFYMVWESCLEVNSQGNDNVLTTSDRSHMEIIGM